MTSSCPNSTEGAIELVQLRLVGVQHLEVSVPVNVLSVPRQCWQRQSVPSISKVQVPITVLALPVPVPLPRVTVRVPIPSIPSVPVPFPLLAFDIQEQ